jgi:hypothetical protein
MVGVLAFEAKDQIETWERRQSPEAALRRALAPWLDGAGAYRAISLSKDGSRFRPDRRAMCPRMRGLFRRYLPLKLSNARITAPP